MLTSPAQRAALEANGWTLDAHATATAERWCKPAAKFGLNYILLLASEPPQVQGELLPILDACAILGLSPTPEKEVRTYVRGLGTS